MITFSPTSFDRFHREAADASERIMRARACRGNTAAIAQLNRLFRAQVVIGYWQKVEGYGFRVMKGLPHIEHLIRDEQAIDIDDVKPAPAFFLVEFEGFADEIAQAFARRPNGRWTFIPGVGLRIV